MNITNKANRLLGREPRPDVCKTMHPAPSEESQPQRKATTAELILEIDGLRVELAKAEAYTEEMLTHWQRKAFWGR